MSASSSAIAPGWAGMPRAGRLAGVRVTFVLNWAFLGGSERQALLLAQHLADVEGATVDVRATTGEDGRGARLFREAGIPWNGRRTHWGGGAARRLRMLADVAGHMRKSKPDVLLPYCELPNVVCGLVWRWIGAATCVWNQRDTFPFTLPDRLVRRAVRSTPLLVSNSEHGGAYLAANWAAEPNRVRVVPNGISLSPPAADRAAWRDRLAVREEDFVVCSLAHLHDRKDHDTLLRAWRVATDRLRGDGVSGVLVLAGRQDHDLGRLQTRAADLGIETSVRFPGEVEDVAGLLRAVDAGVLSSPGEGCPNAFLECMASGLPVAGTDVSGIREALGEVGDEFLAPPGDADGLGRVLARLGLEPDLRDAAGTGNRERVRARYGVERMLDDSVDVILEALSATRRGLSLAAH